jgi:hypothetical protein
MHWFLRTFTGKVRGIPLPLFFVGVLMTTSSFGANADFLKNFESPSAWYHTGPLWVWNDDVTEELIVQQLDMFKSQGILQPFVHPRPGLITPYLSEKWLDLYTFAVHAAKERGMLLNIYDENSYPSGFAGGHVPARHPEWGGKGLVMERVDSLPQTLPEDVVAVYRIEGDTYQIVEDPSGGKEGPHAIVRMVRTPARAWNGGYPYVDLLEPGLTEEFLKITYEPYRKRFGEEFGKTVRGAFTDEPHLQPAGNMHWTPRLPDLFENRYGYPLRQALPSLFVDTGDYKKVRFDFYQLLLDEFIERWSKPYFEYCEKNNLLATGHFWEHGWPSPSHGGDNMAMYAWQQMPAIDCLMNQYNEGVHAQFGNVRAVKELSSIANQFGYERRLCEVYGAGGWEMTFKDQKRISDWLGVLGVNLFNQHLSYMTLRGARKRDHPLSFADHAPWWEHAHLLTKYFARLSFTMSQGEERNRILVLEPTTSAWLLYRAEGGSPEMEALGEEFQRFVTDLSLNQVEYDLASERILREFAKAEDGRLKVQKRDYDLLVIRRTSKNLAKDTFKLVKDYLASGGRVLLVGGKPSLVDGLPKDDVVNLFSTSVAESGGTILGDQGEAVTLPDQEGILEYLKEKLSSVQFFKHDGGKLFHQTRDLGDGNQVLFLCNISADEHSTGTWQASAGSARLLDLCTGKSTGAHFESDNGRIEVAFDLPPAGSALYLIEPEEGKSAEDLPARYASASATLKKVERSAANVLPLDYCSFVAGDRKGENVYFYKAQTEIYQVHGLEGNPWDSAVQFEDRIIKKDAEFGSATGFSVTYRFAVEGFDSPPQLDIVVEQAEKYTIALNGTPLKPSGEWWLDRKFGVLHSGSAVKEGLNELTLVASPFSVHLEVEPVYVLGEFALAGTAQGWTIVPPKDLTYGPWKEQGMPFYSQSVFYDYEIEVKDPKASYRLRLPEWMGTVSSVEVDGKEAGLVAWPPYEVTIGSMDQGKHEVRVEVFGSLKNLLGPHHGNPSLGTAWPGMFKKAPETGPPPGGEYHTLPYGLPGPPEVEVSANP